MMVKPSPAVEQPVIVVVQQAPPEQPPKAPDEVEAYAQKLRDLSSEELEHQLELRLQKAFLFELRRELERRQKTSSSARQPPQPDYDQP